MTAVLRLVAGAACAALLVASAQAQLSTDKPAGTGLKAKPSPAAKAAEKPAAKTEEASTKAVEKIFACIAAGLPKDWKRAWVVITELSGSDKDRKFEGKFLYSADPAGEKQQPLVPCDARQVATDVYNLNDYIEYEKRQWKVATLVFTSDGHFEIKYDYTK
jgi:hypothetical protein